MLQKGTEKLEELFKSQITINNEAYLSVDLILQLYDLISLPINKKQLLSFWINCPQTLETLGKWEIIHNPDFIYNEYVKLKDRGCPLESNITVREWIFRTKAIGIIIVTGRNKGIFLKLDIALDIVLSLTEQIQEYVVERRKQLEEKLKLLRKEYDEQAKLN